VGGFWECGRWSVGGRSEQGGFLGLPVADRNRFTSQQRSVTRRWCACRCACAWVGLACYAHADGATHSAASSCLSVCLSVSVRKRGTGSLSVLFPSLHLAPPHCDRAWYCAWPRCVCVSRCLCMRTSGCLSSCAAVCGQPLSAAVGGTDLPVCACARACACVPDSLLSLGMGVGPSPPLSHTHSHMLRAVRRAAA
jgi:hypothetical protein